MIRDVSKSYTRVCAGSHIPSHLLLFRVSLFSDRPEIQTQALPPVDQVFTCFSWASTSIFPECRDGRAHVLPVKREAFPRGLRINCIRGMVKQGGWLWLWLSWGQLWQRQGRLSPFLSSPLFTFGGAGRKLEWLRGRERRPVLEDSLPPVSPLHPYSSACCFPRWRPGSDCSLLGSSATVE